MSNRWIMNRVGLLNFWYYQNQIFQLADGCMLFRGTNGSGKSLTMQSLFPVLFDGDTSPYRLDSFGSRDRKMEDYLLGEKGVSDRDEGIGYLFLEFKRENREEFLTIGIGMHANRGGKLNKWFFAIDKGQRIGIDFDLFEEVHKDELMPFTKQRLRNRLEGAGRLFENQREYKAFVNERIFGFESIEQFDELITLLINLRSPKLSKEFRPTVVYGILRNSLPKLRDDELLTLSKTIEQMDGHRERLEELSNEIKELDRFSKDYLRWYEEFTGQIAGKWLQTLKEKNSFTKVVKVSEKIISDAQQKLKDNENEIVENEIQLEALSQSITELSQHEGMNLVNRGQKLKELLKDTHVRLSKVRDFVQRKQAQLQEEESQLERQMANWEEKKEELTDLLEDNRQYLSYLRFDELDQTYAQKMLNQITTAEFRYWQAEIEKKQRHFEHVIDLLRDAEQLTEKVQQLQREVGEVQQTIDELSRDLRHWQQTRRSEIEKWKLSIDGWRGGSSFDIEDKNYQELLYRMDQLMEEELPEEEVLEPLHRSFEAALAVNQGVLIPFQNQIKESRNQQAELVAEIQEWQQQKLPEPERSSKRQANRAAFMKETVYLSFYQGVDFDESLSQEKKNNIEGSLYASGIIDALVSPDGLILEDDVQIVPKPQMFTSTLADVMTVNDDLSPQLKALMMDILQSIMLDEENDELPTIFSDGSYHIANMKGQSPAAYEASYIGALSQERYRQAKISALTEELAACEAKISELAAGIKRNQIEKQHIQEAYQARPRGKDVYQTIVEAQKIQLQIEIQIGRLTAKQQETARASSDLAEKQLTLQEQTRADALMLNQVSYQEALRYAGNYAENVKDAYHLQQMIETSAKVIQQMQQTISNQQMDEADYLAQRDDLTAEEQRYERLLAENLKQQQIANVEELQQQLAAVREEEQQRKNHQKELHAQNSSLAGELAKNSEKLTHDKLRLDEITDENELWQQLYEKKITLLLKPDETPEQAAKNNKRELNVKRLKELEDRLTSRFNFLADQLQNYQPQLMTTTGIELEEEQEREFGEFASYNNHLEPVFSKESQRTSTFDLLDQLKNQKLTLQELLKKDDERLFKNIILESVGNILRSRIQQAQSWVEQMNQLLQEQKNSSSLTLSIGWKPVPSESETDLGTARLVSLLQKPAALLSEVDRSAISQHFQEKVRYAQEQVEENADGSSTLFQAITQVLDYRDWFEFELKYKRGNEGYQPQTLTDRRFNQFSGGEKAVSMYLPLFAAVYSRYGEASPDCPKIITLDEAFAGIDDQNIAELFKACEQLNFNYVMNSQVLFGDYPTVDSLMIYELLRPQNINLVTTICYYWNGRSKQMMVEDYYAQ